jgi:hypothetical protein
MSTPPVSSAVTRRRPPDQETSVLILAAIVFVAAIAGLVLAGVRPITPVTLEEQEPAR